MKIGKCRFIKKKKKYYKLKCVSIINHFVLYIFQAMGKDTYIKVVSITYLVDFCWNAENSNTL